MRSNLHVQQKSHRHLQRHPLTQDLKRGPEPRAADAAPGPGSADFGAAVHSAPVGRVSHAAGAKAAENFPARGEGVVFGQDKKEVLWRAYARVDQSD